jgi:hypothetical protein
MHIKLKYIRIKTDLYLIDSILCKYDYYIGIN